MNNFLDTWMSYSFLENFGGIAFSLQTVIASIAGWLVIIFSSFYKVGDRVKVGTITGDVIDIGVLSTTLMSFHFYGMNSNFPCIMEVL